MKISFHARMKKTENSLAGKTKVDNALDLRDKNGKKKRKEKL